MWHEFEEHIQWIDEILTVFEKAGLQINLPKSVIYQKALAQLGFMLIKDGFKPLEQRIQGILDIASLKNKKEVRMCIAMINFIRNHVKDRADILAPLNRLTKKDVPQQWKEDEMNAFIRSKKAIAEAVLLTYPRPGKLFVLYPDASDLQIGAQLTQCGLTAGLFSKKLIDTQKRYPVIHKELLTVDAGLKYFKNIIKGAEILIRTDHENLTHSAIHSDDRVNRVICRINDDFGARQEYWASAKNIGGDAMSRLPTIALELKT